MNWNDPAMAELAEAETKIPIEYLKNGLIPLNQLHSVLATNTLYDSKM